MIQHHEQATGEDGACRAAEADPPREAERSTGAALAGAGARLLEIVELARRLLRIQRERRQLVLRRALAQLAAGVALAAGGATLVVLASLSLMAGLRGGLRELSGGRVWMGDLLAGALVLAALGLVFALARRRSERRGLERKRSEHEALVERIRRSSPAAGPPSGAAPEDAGRAP